MFAKVLPLSCRKGRRFLWGTIATFALRRHYEREVRPYAENNGYAREDILEGAHIALDRHFKTAWPTNTLPLTEETPDAG